MEAGREMDVLVAEGVMGWRRGTGGEFDPVWVNWDGSTCSGADRFEPSTDIAAAVEVLEHLDELGHYFHIDSVGYPEKWRVQIGWNDDPSVGLGFSDSLAHAICIAALSLGATHGT